MGAEREHRFGEPIQPGLLEGFGNIREQGDRQMSEQTREALAAYSHTAWSGWMKYLFSKSCFNADGSATIPKWAVNRWARQARTSYSRLPEEEKTSDRQEADRILAVLRALP